MIKRLLFLLLAITVVGCDDPFQYHPWEEELPKDEQDINEQSISQIQQRLDGTNASFQFAVISDPHFYYDALEDVLKYIKNDGSMQFIMVAGDLADQGLSHEFLWYADLMEDAELPFVTVIGNHDHLGNGRVVFERMFGPRNHVFVAGGARFILFDNVEFESTVDVDHAWLSQQLAIPFNGPTMVFMHIQPTDVQLEGPPGQRLADIMELYTPDAVFMGHLHSYDSQLFPGGTRWAVGPWPRNEKFLKVTVTPSAITHQLITLP